ncbi:hypothetical protein T492DRAFT_108850 [Pavlovales sp. CCMP2436]|nr:hypothetical protein T492DRAFT_108850 [Pavlovales sp. CCMP2436]
MVCGQGLRDRLERGRAVAGAAHEGGQGGSTRQGEEGPVAASAACLGRARRGRAGLGSQGAWAAAARMGGGSGLGGGGRRIGRNASPIAGWLLALVLLSPLARALPLGGSDGGVTEDGGSGRLPRVDILFTAECVPPFDWMAAGLFESFRALYGDGNGGRVRMTRLLACSPQQLEGYRETPGWRLGPTFVHTNYKHNPHNGETSGSYNKPGSIMHWTQSAEANGAETILFIDADMEV